MLSLVEITAFRLESKSCKGFFFKSTKESTRIITGHVIYNPAYTYKFQLKTTFLMIELSIFHPQDQQKCDWLEYRGNKVVQRRFHKHKIPCQNPSLFSNHQRKDLSIAIFFVVESYIFHMALYRLFFVRSIDIKVALSQKI